MPLKELYGLFPKLRKSKHAITSDADKNYNCVAWVLGKTKEFWTPYGTIIPASFPPYRWRQDVPQDGSVDSYTLLFKKFGFELAADDTPEPGFQKIALYGQAGRFTHVAKQLNSGLWSSKLGDLEDVEHELSALEKDGPNRYVYGRVARFLKKPLRQRKLRAVEGARKSRKAGPS